MVKKIVVGEMPKSENVKEVNNEIRELIKDMKDTLKATENGVGLSACQIGINKNVIIFEYGNGSLLPMINPVIIKKSGKITLGVEGCLSVPGVQRLIPRHERIKVSFLDGFGRRKISEFVGFTARIIQHEISHLKGKCDVSDEKFMDYETFKNKIKEKIKFENKETK